MIQEPFRSAVSFRLASLEGGDGPRDGFARAGYDMDGGPPPTQWYRTRQGDILVLAAHVGDFMTYSLPELTEEFEQKPHEHYATHRPRTSQHTL